MSAQPIQIIGGGVAGLALGILLRQRRVVTTVWEAGSYPRHRVCGEVLSGRGIYGLQDLGLWPTVLAKRAYLAQTSRFFTESGSTAGLRLPHNALCLSRFELDELLARQFQELGGELRLNERWLRASGRAVQVRDEKGWRWFGLKAHCRDVELAADVEVHVFDSGYVGLCRLQGGRVNVCGLFRTVRPEPELRATWREWLTGSTESVLRCRLRSAQWEDNSFCAVAGLPVGNRCVSGSEECRVGDSIGMIAPVTGNGMSLALESAELAAPFLIGYSQGQLTWSAACAAVAERANAQFGQRLERAAWLNRGLFQPLARALLLAGSQWSWAWRAGFALTR
jgi:flavin-dependent dehydrogenase